MSRVGIPLERFAHHEWRDDGRECCASGDVAALESEVLALRKAAEDVCDYLGAADGQTMGHLLDALREALGRGDSA